MPGAKEIERVKGLLQSTAQLEFWDAFKGEEFGTFIFQANETLKEIVETLQQKKNPTQPNQQTMQSLILLEIPMLKQVIHGEVNPLIDLIRAPGYNGGPVIASFEQKDKQLVTDYSKQPTSSCAVISQNNGMQNLYGESSSSTN